MRTANIQFTFFTAEMAREYLRRNRRNFAAESHGDRLQALNALRPHTTAEERKEAHDWNRAVTVEEFLLLHPRFRPAFEASQVARA